MIDKIKIWIEILKDVATILAIIAGGVWFYLQRSTTQQVKLEQTVTQRVVVGHPDQLLVTVDVRATNIGKVKVELQPGALEVMQVNPRADHPGVPLASYILKPLTLEPAESDQAIFQAFRLPETVHTIQVHSDYPVPNASHKFWNLLSFVDVGTDASRRETATSVH